MTPQEQIEIIEAYERGEEIEWRKKNSDMHFVILNDKNHDFNFEHFDYRIKQKPKRWRAEKGEKYYYLTPSLAVVSSKDDYWDFDVVRFNAGNYFRTQEQAENARELLKETLTKFHEENE